MIVLRFVLITWLMATLSLNACNKGPKKIAFSEAEIDPAAQLASGIFADQSDVPPPVVDSKELSEDIHTIRVNEVLPTDKYVYLNVTEGEEDFWIATLKKEVEVGKLYFYRSSLLQTNFESKEYNRTFDKIYLVSNIVPADHGSSVVMNDSPNDDLNAPPTVTQPGVEVVVEGSVRIADIVADPESYGGQTIQVSGECTKVNDDIMGRNWIHLKDGSMDDYDFVITSTERVTEGQIVTMSGIIGLDRDFGAGYRYDIIMEDGKLENRSF